MTWTIDEDGCHTVRGRDCWIWMQARPHYCDRGNWLAHVEVNVEYEGAALRLGLDIQDGWPRYYFDLDRAKAEIEAWLTKRGQLP